MKKLVICFLILFLIIFLNTKEETLSVFKQSNEEYTMYTLIFKNNNISTNNFNEYFQNIKVISIKPYINNIYKKEMNKYKQYNFDYISVQGNINKFTNHFIKQLENSNFKTQALKLRIDGIIIESTTIYSNEDEINKLKNKIENIEIKS